MRNGDVYDLPEVGRMALASNDRFAVLSLEESIKFLDPTEVVAMEPLEAASWTTE
jgi:hypothetical protein